MATRGDQHIYITKSIQQNYTPLHEEPKVLSIDLPKKLCSSIERPSVVKFWHHSNQGPTYDDWLPLVLFGPREKGANVAKFGITLKPNLDEEPCPG